jgi:hypothetical protein
MGLARSSGGDSAISLVGIALWSRAGHDVAAAIVLLRLSHMAGSYGYLARSGLASCQGPELEALVHAAWCCSVGPTDNCGIPALAAEPMVAHVLRRSTRTAFGPFLGVY